VDRVDLWNTYGDCTNYGVIKGHIGAILELHWSRDGRYEHIPFTCIMNIFRQIATRYRVAHIFFYCVCCSMIFTASADKTCGVFDVQTGERIKRFKGHTTFVNSCSPARKGPELLASGSDDGSVKVTNSSPCPIGKGTNQSLTLTSYGAIYNHRSGISAQRMQSKLLNHSIKSHPSHFQMQAIWFLLEALTTTLLLGICVRRVYLTL
jgi:WD40 repeat protein